MSADNSIDRAQREIIDEMGGLKNTMEKYEYLLSQASELPRPGTDLKTDSNRINGCQSSVWIDLEFGGNGTKIRAHSEAEIVRGILGLLHRVLAGQPPGQVASAELYFLEETGLADQLSPHRSNGLESILERIRSACRRTAAE